MNKRYALSDARWERIKDLLPGQAGQPGATAKDNRLFVDAVLYLYRAGSGVNLTASCTKRVTSSRTSSRV